MTELQFYFLYGVIGLTIVALGAWLDRQENRRRHQLSPRTMKGIQWPIPMIFQWRGISGYPRVAAFPFPDTWRHGSAYLWRLKITW